MPDTDYSVFSYLTAPNAERYIGIMRCFVAAKQRFLLHVKPADLLRELPQANRDELEHDLTQLTEWGNLRRQADMTEARTVEEFQRSKFVYQLSAAGEAAERALAVFRENLQRPGELQSTALADIEAGLHELAGLLKPGGDETRLYSAFQSLFARFEQLAQRAQQFISTVRRDIDRQDEKVEAFIAYKEGLIGYIEQFLQQLVIRTPTVSAMLLELAETGVEHALADMANRELRDVLNLTEEHRIRVHADWRGRWQGLESWFHHRDGPSQAEHLRACARAAISDLLVMASAINDQRVQRSDRAADYRTLARWFATAETDAEAHRLWREAFCLSPCRHLTIDAETLAEHEEAGGSPVLSWLEAPPMRISPQLRASGRARTPGRQAAMVNHSTDLSLLRQRLAREAEQMARARVRIATNARCRLSEFAELDAEEFDLFLDCLGAALSRVSDHADAAVEAPSSDGSLLVSLERIPGAPEVRLATSLGTLSGPDCWICIREAFHHVG